MGGLIRLKKGGWARRGRCSDRDRQGREGCYNNDKRREAYYDFIEQTQFTPATYGRPF
jgi:hypothetical protein